MKSMLCKPVVMAAASGLLLLGCADQEPIAHRPDEVIYDMLLKARSVLKFCSNADYEPSKKRLDCIDKMDSLKIGSEASFATYSLSRNCPGFCGGTYVGVIYRKSSEPRLFDITMLPIATSPYISSSDTSGIQTLCDYLIRGRKKWRQVTQGMADLGLSTSSQVGLYSGLSRLSRTSASPMLPPRQVTLSDSGWVRSRFRNSRTLNSRLSYIDSLESSLLNSMRLSDSLDKFWFLPDSTILFYDTTDSHTSISPVYLFPEKVYTLRF